MSALSSWALAPARGMHPVSRATLRLAPADCADARADRCALHVRHALPRALFGDPHELALRAPGYAARVAGGGAVDLEAPAFAVAPARAGRAVHVRVGARSVGEACAGGGELLVEVPLHLRYLEPRSGGEGPAVVDVEVDPPTAFWACTIDGSEADDSLGASGAFAEVFPNHTLHVLPPAPGVRAQVLRAPVGDMRDLELVEAGTVLVVLLAACYVGWKILRASRRIAAKESKMKDE